MQHAVPEELLPLVGGFLRGRLAEITVLREALRRHDFETVKLLGHRLKGNGASFGFPLLSDMGADLEASALIGNGREGLQLVEDLEKMVKRFQIGFHEDMELRRKNLK